MNPEPVEPEVEVLGETVVEDRKPRRELTPVERGEMTVSEFRFLEPFMDKACFCCGAKDKFRRRKKLLHCEGCHTEFMPMPDGKLAIMNRMAQPAAA